MFLYIFKYYTFFRTFFNIDSAGSGGFIKDFEYTFPLVENPLAFTTGFRN